MKRNPRIDTALLGVLLITLILAPATIGTIWLPVLLVALALVAGLTTWRHQ